MNPADAVQAWAPKWLLDTSRSAECAFVHSSPLTKFEAAMVCGYRGCQLAQGERSFLPNEHETADTGKEEDPILVAERELNTGLLSHLGVVRYMPDGTMHRKPLSELAVFPRH